MSGASPSKKLTEAEFLKLERQAEFKSEFYDGEVFAMSGGTRWHSLIGTNLAAEFRSHNRGASSVPYSGDLRLKVGATALLTYPDLSVARASPRFLDEGVATLLNPAVVVEVLSDSTEAYDRGKKFEHYPRMPSLTEYLLVSQKEPHVERFLRQEDGQWLLSEVAGLESSLELPSLGNTIALCEIHAGVEFAPAPIRSIHDSNS